MKVRGHAYGLQPSFGLHFRCGDKTLGFRMKKMGLVQRGSKTFDRLCEIEPRRGAACCSALAQLSGLVIDNQSHLG